MAFVHPHEAGFPLRTVHVNLAISQQVARQCSCREKLTSHTRVFNANRTWDQLRKQEEALAVGLRPGGLPGPHGESCLGPRGEYTHAVRADELPTCWHESP